MRDAIPPDAMAERLAAFVAREAGLSPAAVRASVPRRLAGGASRETWALDVTLDRGDGPERLELVLRRDPPGRIGDGGDRGLELRVLRAAQAARVPVPRVHWGSDDPDVLGSPFFLMDRVAGEALPRRLLRDERYARTRAVLTAQLGEALARVHETDLAAPGLDALPRPPRGVPPARFEVEKTAAAIRELGVEPHPVLDLAERWLLERAPEPPRIALVHGDFRVGNVLFDEDGLRAVLDWELVHVGDPIEDLGWLCTRAWRFGSPLPVGGVGTREELVAAYEAASGTKVDRDALHFWEAFGSFKLGLVFIMQSRVFLDGRVASLELASLGRRTVEAEDELLRVLREVVNDRPTAVELLGAVERFLEEQVVPALENPARFHARVAANVVRIVAAEIRTEDEHLAREWEGLAALLGADATRPEARDDLRAELRARNEDLVRRIRAGEADAGAWRGEVLEHLSRVVADKLAVSQPPRSK